MQIRLLASIAGGLAGLACASWLNQSMGISMAFAAIVCGLVGVAVGYVVSMVFDVFTSSASSDTTSHQSDS